MLQSLTEQSTHGMAEQVTLVERGGHAVPPPNAASVTTRDLWDLPTAHCLSQVVHALHDVTAQSTGHTGAIEQEPSSVVLEHATPPAEAGVSIVRIRWRDPVSHVREHGLHGCHAPWEQSIGHASAAQLSVSERTGHKRPPLLAAVCTERVRLEVPAPQLTAQADHWPHALTAQSTGHDELPHSALSLVSGQLSPSPTRGRVTLLVRSAMPVSQLREHVPHATQSLTEQLTGTVGVAVVGTGVEGVADEGVGVEGMMDEGLAVVGEADGVCVVGASVGVPVVGERVGVSVGATLRGLDVNCVRA